MIRNPWRTVGLALVALLNARLVLAEIATVDEFLSRAPDCSVTCLENTLNNTACALNDLSCMCSGSVEGENMRVDIVTCVQGACSAADALKFRNATATSCDAPTANYTGDFVKRTIAVVAIAGFCVLLRFGWKLSQSMDLCADDWITMTTMLVTVVSTIISTEGLAKNGLGKDVWTLEPGHIYDFGKWLMAFNTLYYIEVALSKLCVLFFYLRIFPSKLVKNLLWGTIGFCVVYPLPFVFSSVFQCKPVSYFWNAWDMMHDGACIKKSEAIPISNAAFSIVLDIWMIAIPLWQLHYLQLDWKKKIGVGLMFIVGIIITITSIIRLHMFLKNQGYFVNPTVQWFWFCFWSNLEITTAIFCACMPAIRQVLAKGFPRVFANASSLAKKYGSNKTGTNASATHNKSQLSTANGETITIITAGELPQPPPQSHVHELPADHQPRSGPRSRLSQWLQGKRETLRTQGDDMGKPRKLSGGSNTDSTGSMDVPIALSDLNPSSMGRRENADDKV